MKKRNDIQSKIMALLQNNLMSTSQLARKLGIRRDVLAGYLQALRDQGKLEFFKVGRSHVYTLKRGEK